MRAINKKHHKQTQNQYQSISKYQGPNKKHQRSHTHTHLFHSSLSSDRLPLQKQKNSHQAHQKVIYPQYKNQMVDLHDDNLDQDGRKNPLLQRLQNQYLFSKKQEEQKLRENCEVKNNKQNNFASNNAMLKSVPLKKVGKNPLNFGQLNKNRKEMLGKNIQNQKIDRIQQQIVVQKEKNSQPVARFRTQQGYSPMMTKSRYGLDDNSLQYYEFSDEPKKNKEEQVSDQQETIQPSKKANIKNKKYLNNKQLICQSMEDISLLRNNKKYSHKQDQDEQQYMSHSHMSRYMCHSNVHQDNIYEQQEYEQERNFNNSKQYGIPESIIQNHNHQLRPLTFGTIKKPQPLKTSIEYKQQRILKNQVLEEINQFRRSQQSSYNAKQPEMIKKPQNLFCSNHTNRKAKYRLQVKDKYSDENGQEDLQMIYCSKCAINLLQQGFKVQEIQNINKIMANNTNQQEIEGGVSHKSYYQQRQSEQQGEDSQEEDGANQCQQGQQNDEENIRLRQRRNNVPTIYQSNKNIKANNVPGNNMTASYKSMKNYYTYNNQMNNAQSRKINRNYMTRSTNSNYHLQQEKKKMDNNFKNVANSRLQEMRNFEVQLNQIEEKIDGCLSRNKKIADDVDFYSENTLSNKIRESKGLIQELFANLHHILEDLETKYIDQISNRQKQQQNLSKYLKMLKQQKESIKQMKKQMKQYRNKFIIMREQQFHFLMTSFSNKIKQYGRQYQSDHNFPSQNFKKFNNFLSTIQDNQDISQKIKEENILEQIFQQFALEAQRNIEQDSQQKIYQQCYQNENSMNRTEKQCSDNQIMLQQDDFICEQIKRPFRTLFPEETPKNQQHLYGQKHQANMEEQPESFYSSPYNMNHESGHRQYQQNQNNAQFKYVQYQCSQCQGYSQCKCTSINIQYSKKELMESPSFKKDNVKEGNMKRMMMSNRYR